jgi:hypothetical protein
MIESEQVSFFPLGGTKGCVLRGKALAMTFAYFVANLACYTAMQNEIK